MICPRCDSKTVKLLTKAPIDDAWEIYICETCDFTWRSTEGEDVTNPEKYDKKFKIDPTSIDDRPELPPIPELIKKND